MYKQCEDCSEAMKKVLLQHIELVTMQDEVERIKEINTELEGEIEIRNKDLIEKNEKLLSIEKQTKNFIKSQHKSISDLIIKFDQIFLFNQKKFSMSSKIKNIFDNISNEINYISNINKNNCDSNNTNVISLDKIGDFIEDSYNKIQSIEKLILNDNKIFYKIIEIMNEISYSLENHIEKNFAKNEFIDIEDDKDIDNHSLNDNDNEQLNNISNGNSFNKINLNFNKNININFINSKVDCGNKSNSFVKNNSKKNKPINNNKFDIIQKERRTNSFSYFDMFNENNNIKINNYQFKKSKSIRNSTENKEKDKLKAFKTFNSIKSKIRKNNKKIILNKIKKNKN
jgi:hypothetical protein